MAWSKSFASKLDWEIAAFEAIAPSSRAVRSRSAPPYSPIGVRLAETMTISFIRKLYKKERARWGLRPWHVFARAFIRSRFAGLYQPPRPLRGHPSFERRGMGLVPRRPHSAPFQRRGGRAAAGVVSNMSRVAAPYRCPRVARSFLKNRA